MKKLTKILKPSYLQNFKCIGGDCEDSCCIGWNIDIDKLTFRKYFRTKNSSMKENFKKYVYKNEECEFDEIDYGRMKILNNKWCPFLDNDKLCNIFKNLGEDYLSNVCHSFPRIYNVLNNTYELSLSMSCPEAVRLLFEQKSKIKFIKENIPLEKYIIHSYVDLKDKQWTNSPIKDLEKLRSMSISIIQNRNYSIEKRLSMIGNNLLKETTTTPLIVADIFAFQLSFFKDSINTLNVDSEIESPLFKKYTTSLLKGFLLDQPKDLKKSVGIYTQINQNILKPFIENNSYLFEHYLVNSIFQSNFPFNINQEQFDGYLILIIRFAFIKFYLAGIALENSKITKDDVISMVQTHTKIINHHDSFIFETLNTIKDKEFNNLDFTNIILGLK